jgi:hypothetical protein
MSASPHPKDAPPPPSLGTSPRPTAAFALILKRLWEGDIDLGRVGLMVAVPVLMWVFYTTSSGMIDIMRKEAGDWVGVAGASSPPRPS